MSPMEFGIISLPLPNRAVAAATAAEEDGYDVVLLPDSQNLYGDPYTELALIAKATSRIRLGPGVTNPITRHPAVTAASIFSVAFAFTSGMSGNSSAAMPLISTSDSGVRA